MAGGGWLARCRTGKASRVSGCREKTSRHQGVVKHVDRSKGFGFIKCDEMHERYGSDVFFRDCDLEEGEVGSCVCFSLSQGKCGRPQASNLKLFEEHRPEKKDDDKSVPIMFGTIKSFDVGHGYGFISCAETFAKHGRDVFIHKDQLSHFRVGQLVSFVVKANSAGHPQAYNLGEVPDTLEWLGESQLDTSGENKLDPSEHMLNNKYIGTVKNINDVKQCGFIECEELHTQFGRDVFFPLALLPGLRSGERVEFQARVRNRQPQAHVVARDSGVGDLPRPVAENEHKAADLASAELTKKLLRACASSRKDSYSRMFELLHAGADANGRDVTGQTALMVCALNHAESERKCRLLVGMGADVHAKYTGDLTVLQWARERLSHRFAEHLAALSRGEQIDCLISLDTMGVGEV